MFEKVVGGLGKQKDRLKLFRESPVVDPLMVIGNFNRQFTLEEMEKSAVEWAWPQEMTISGSDQDALLKFHFISFHSSC